MQAAPLAHLLTAAGACAIGVVAFTRGRPGPLLRAILWTALLIAAWSAAHGLWLLTQGEFWRLLAPALGPLPLAAFAVLALRAALPGSSLRTGLEGVGVLLAGAYSLWTLLAFVLDDARSFVLSDRWNWGYLMIAIPIISIASIALLHGSLRGQRSRQRLCRPLLAAGAVGMAAGISQVMPPDRPLQLGSLGLLIAVLVGAVAVSGVDEEDQGIAVKEVLVALGTVVGLAVIVSLAVARADTYPGISAAILTLTGITAYAVYRHSQQAWQQQLTEAARLSALGRATSVLAHELRNPLTTIKGSLDLLEMDLQEALGDSSEPSYLQLARTEMNRILTLLGDCLDYARAPEPRRESFAMHTVLQPVVEAARLRFSHSSIDCRAPSDPIHVQADSGQIIRLVENLVCNACQSRPGAQVSLSWSLLDRDEIELRVADDGPGVAEDIRERIFEPFFTTKDRGGGLGLPICREIMRRHGGDLWVEDGESGGAIFVARWPQSQEKIDA